MNKDDYIKRIEEKLNDKSIYEEVKDPTNVVKNKIAELINGLFKNSCISHHTKYELSSIDGIPHIRGQPTLHKKGQLDRLITNTTLCSLSKYGFMFVKELRGNIRIRHVICHNS